MQQKKKTLHTQNKNPEVPETCRRSEASNVTRFTYERNEVTEWNKTLKRTKAVSVDKSSKY